MYSNLLHKLRRFQQLTPQQKSILFQAAALLVINSLVMRTSNFKRVYILATKNPRHQSQPTSTDLFSPNQIVELANTAAAFMPFRPTCLIRSLVLWQLLRRYCFDSQLCVGVRKEGRSLNAHAWIEYEGVVLNDQADVRQRFATFNLPIDQVMKMRFL